MSLFAIIRAPDASNNDALSGLLLRKYPENVYRLSKGQWVISTPNDRSAQDLSRDIGVRVDSRYNHTLVVQVQSYSGLYEEKFWDWIKARSH
jgi:hypothetical protein